MTDMVNLKLFILNYAWNLWGGVKFGPLERELVRWPQTFILFSERYFKSPWIKNKILRFSTSDFLIHDLFLKQNPIFDELPKYIMQYIVTARANK